jgi:hypothetical protein
MHCGAEVTESSTNKQHHLSQLAQREAPAAEYFPVGQLVQRSVSPAACFAHVAVLHHLVQNTLSCIWQLAASLLALVENEA